MVRLLEIETTPTCVQCVTICKTIVYEYPQSFADQLHDGRIIGEGNISLLDQIKTELRTAVGTPASDSTGHQSMWCKICPTRERRILV